ncbi:TetR/AcrR family transcriptional regulator [Pseudoduganella umbonata]|uniref:AcrR family transcriptional regulator n=1 Tax=Pseudoduganella umbonata TaxID=864828 RepID=A0A4P8HMF7_9BURK|nr:TetR/AcrR family transcriptional regulator [Pseudoduganella umbonata]MBB3219517.1 AcrR family transcriptional regulator [Pseudoduganella umbonata]QCP09594.1 TetR/AcrR family transcriptional regulator [Pseudoduganella umbonata]
MRSKSEERRVQIMRVAADTFSELGVENTTMSEIVARMGGSKATIYNYFPSKADLVQAVLARESELKLRQAFMALDPDLPAGDALHRFGRNYLLHLLSPDMVSVLRIALQDGDRSDAGRVFYATGPAAGWRLMQQYLERQVAAGAIVRCDARVAAMHLKGLLQGELLDRTMLGEPAPLPAGIEAVADRAIEVFLRAYAPR